MKKTYADRIHRRDEQPPREFWAYFNGPDLYASRQLWHSYQLWSRARARDGFARFMREYNEQRQQAAQDMDSLKNPFANATRGQPYAISFALPASVGKFQISQLPAGLDWRYHPSSRMCAISGAPAAPGDYKILFQWIWRGWRRGMPILQKQFTFTVNPDTADLWQDIPSDPEAEYARPDYEYETMACAGAHMWGASLRGRSHAHKGLPRDDAFALACINGWQVLAVADGAGSASFSRKGAEIACASVIQACMGSLSQPGELERLLQGYAPDQPEWLKAARRQAYNILPQAAFAANKAIRAEAQARDRQPRDYATTLLISVARRLEQGWAILAFQIGDGAMAAFTPDSAQLLCSPDEGEYGGQTRFVTMHELFDPHELMRRLKVLVLPRLEGIALLTDGITDARLASLDSLNSPELWRGLWNEYMKICASKDPEQEFRDWLNFWSRGNHDDRTLTLLVTNQ